MSGLGRALTIAARTVIRASADAAVTTAAALTGAAAPTGSSGVGTATDLGGRRRVTAEFGGHSRQGSAAGGERWPRSRPGALRPLVPHDDDGGDHQGDRPGGE